MDETLVREWLDRLEVMRVVDAIDFAVDRKDWAAARGHFTDDITADFSSLVGGGPVKMKADALVAGWKKSLYADKLSHHMRTNHQVTITGDRAEVLSQGFAWNKLTIGSGSNLWETWGTYRHTLVRTAQGWKVDAMTYDAHHSRGNEKVREYVPDGK